MQSEPGTVAVSDYLPPGKNAKFVHEYWDRSLIARTGAAREHSVNTSNTLAALTNQLRGQCCTVQNGLKVRLSPEKFIYQDITVVCGEPELTNERPRLF